VHQILTSSRNSNYVEVKVLIIKRMNILDNIIFGGTRKFLGLYEVLI